MLLPRIARENIQSNFIHIVTEGIEKEFIFYKDDYKNVYINILRKYINESKNLRLVAYCIMSNHAHILINMQETNELIKAMRKINTAYAIYYNKNEERVGYVFANRYYSQPIKDEKHLFTCIKYIHENPVKAGLAKKPKEYKFSSFNEFYSNKLDKKVAKIIFGTENYLKDFYNIKVDENIDIIDISREIDKLNENKQKIEILISNFCEEYKVNLNQIKLSNQLILKFKEYLNQNSKITNKTICGILGIGKNRIKWIENNKK